jgi:hypothetical protein
LKALLASGQAGKPQLFLNANDTKLPHSIQSSFGVRQALGAYLVSASYGTINGYNSFVFLPARNQTTGNLISGPGFDQILLSSDAARSWYRALYLKLERPLVGDAKWGGQFSYTLSKSETNGTDEGQGNFNYDVLNEKSFQRHPTQGDERSHVSANWVRVLPAQFQFSGTLTLGTGTPYNVISGCPNTKQFVDSLRATGGGNASFEQFCVDKGYYGNGNFTAEDDFAPGIGRNSGRPPRYPFLFGQWAYRNVDLRVSKRFTMRDRGIEVIGEAFNAFGFDNLRYNERNLRYDQQSAPLDYGSGQRTTYQIGAKIGF